MSLEVWLISRLFFSVLPRFLNLLFKEAHDCTTVIGQYRIIQESTMIDTITSDIDNSNQDVHRPIYINRDWLSLKISKGAQWMRHLADAEDEVINLNKIAKEPMPDSPMRPLTLVPFVMFNAILKARFPGKSMSFSSLCTLSC